MDGWYNSQGAELTAYRPAQQRSQPLVLQSQSFGEYMTLSAMTDRSETDRRLDEEGIDRKEYEEFRKKRKQLELDKDNTFKYIALLTNSITDAGEEKLLMIYDEEKEKEQKQAAERAKKKEDKYNRWMRFMGPSGDGLYIEVQVDTGADVNAITEGMVKACGLQKKPLLQPENLEQVVGHSFTCKYGVELNWMGPGNRKHGVEHFFILPDDANIERPVLAKHWMQQTDSLYEINPNPTKSIQILRAKKETTEEKQTREQLRLQMETQREMNMKNKDKFKQTDQSREQQKRSSSSKATVKKSG